MRAARGNLIAASSVDSALGGAGTWPGAQRWLDRATARELI
jgi:hypothetical protein